MRLWLISAVLVACSCCSAQTIELSTSPFPSLYGYLRNAQAPGAKLPPGKLGEAVNDLVKIEATFPDEIRMRSGTVITAEDGKRDRVIEMYWRTIDGLVYGTASLDELKALPGQLPEKLGGHLNTSQTFNTIIKALQKAQAPYESQVWPKEKAKVDAQLAYWKEFVGMKGLDALKWIASTLGMSKTPNWVDIVIVPDAGGKEGMTVLRPEGLRVIIGAGAYQKDEFAEVVLHESTHVLDATDATEGLLFGLRQALKDAKRSTFEVEQVPHTLMFLLGAEAARKFVDPKHVDVGKTHGIYGRGLERLRAIIAPELEKLLGGQQTREQMIAAIVTKL